MTVNELINSLLNLVANGQAVLQTDVKFTSNLQTGDDTQDIVYVEVDEENEEVVLASENNE